MQDSVYDLFIIGGGVNGCGIARDAAGRGLRVGLAEMGDLAQGTSSASTKLIHGGLRYLEHYAFRLVHEALAEREVLLRIAPHIVRPLRFVLPHATGMRPAWLLRAGLFIYDHLGGRKSLPSTRTLDLRNDEAGAPLKPDFTRGFEYSDCWVDDARLVVLNAMDAAARGADILVRTRVVTARRVEGLWHVSLAGETGRQEVTARALVDAGGAWARALAGDVFGAAGKPPVRLVKGSHIVVPRLFAHERSYIFQQRDGRIVFAIPYEGAFTLIGTTDVDYAGDPLDARASEEEITYLLKAVAPYFREAPNRDSVVWTYAGVRGLYDDGASAAKDATREYVLARDELTPPLLHVYGGKITTYRRLAEAALAKLEDGLPPLRHASGARAGWTHLAVLPGGDVPSEGMSALQTQCTALYPWLAPDIRARLLRSYGTLAFTLLGDARGPADLGADFGAGLSEREVDYLRTCEWARSSQDILWRRSKLGLHMRQAERDALAAYLGERAG